MTQIREDRVELKEKQEKPRFRRLVGYRILCGTHGCHRLARWHEKADLGDGCEANYFYCGTCKRRIESR